MASQSLRPQTQKMGIIFHRDMCVEKNTSQLQVWNFCARRKNYARSRLQTFCRKIPSEFSDSKKSAARRLHFFADII